MPVLQKKISVPANSESDNFFANTEYEFLAAPAKVTVSAIAQSGDDGWLDWKMGSVNLIDQAYMKQGSDFPIIPDNILDAENIDAGQRNILIFHNDNAAAKDFWVRVDVDYL